MANILVVEDDLNIQKLIMASLALSGHESQSCLRGDEVEPILDAGRFDLILLDIMLPGMDGYEVMQRIAYREIPVIFLTARESVADRVTGLNLGADDYIIKPFEPVELLARIDVVLRRTGRGQDLLSFNGIEICISQHTVHKDGRSVALTPKEFDLLVLLVRNKNIAFSREKMLSTVWGYDFAGETRTVDIHIQQLRKKLGLRNHLLTIPRVGYRLES